MARKEIELAPAPVYDQVMTNTGLSLSLAKRQSPNSSRHQLTGHIPGHPHKDPEEEVGKKRPPSVLRTKFDVQSNFRGSDRNNNVIIRVNPNPNRYAVIIPGKLTTNGD